MPSMTVQPSEGLSSSKDCMIRALFAFVFLLIAFHAGIQVIRSMNGKEKWEFIKTFTYAMGLSVAAVTFLIGIVVLF